MTEYWVTVDFRPAPAGWRIAFLFPDHGGAATMPMPGWVVQEEVGSQFESDTPTSRQVVAAMIVDGKIMSALDNPAFWQVLAPTLPDPDQDEIDEALAERGDGIRIAIADLLRNAPSS